MAGKSFKRAVNSDPIWFDLPGLGDTAVRFDCIDVLPGGMLLDFGAVMDTDSGKDQAAAVWGLFEAAIVPDQFEKFAAMCRDKRLGIGLPMMTDVAEFLSGEYTSRENPTPVPSGNTSPRITYGDASTDGVLHAVSTYSRSEPTPAST